MQEYLFGCHKRTTALDLAHQTWPELNQDLQIGFVSKKVDSWPDGLLSCVEGFLTILTLFFCWMRNYENHSGHHWKVFYGD